MRVTSREEENQTPLSKADYESFVFRRHAFRAISLAPRSINLLPSNRGLGMHEENAEVNEGEGQRSKANDPVDKKKRILCLHAMRCFSEKVQFLRERVLCVLAQVDSHSKSTSAFFRSWS